MYHVHANVIYSMNSPQVVMVTVSNCSEDQQYLVGVVGSCDLEAVLHSQDHRSALTDLDSAMPFDLCPQCRILDATTPLYLGGLDPYISSRNPPVSSTSYEGCISNVLLNQHLVDLSTPLYELGTVPGCPPLEDRVCVLQCSQCGLEVWNGTLCTCDSQTCQGTLHLKNSNSSNKISQNPLPCAM